MIQILTTSRFQSTTVGVLLLEWQESHGDLNIFCYRMGGQVLAGMIPARQRLSHTACSAFSRAFSTPSPTSAD